MHYIKTLYSMIFFLTACGFSVFTLQVEQMGERVATNFTLLLTMVSYKFAMNDILPRLEYFTFLDQYIYLAFGMVILIVFESVCIQKAWSSRDTDEQKQTVLDYDTYFAYMWIFLWLTISAFTALMATVILHRNDVGPALEVTNNGANSRVYENAFSSFFAKKFHPQYLAPLYHRYVSPETEQKPHLSPRARQRHRMNNRVVPKEEIESKLEAGLDSLSSNNDEGGDDGRSSKTPGFSPAPGPPIKQFKRMDTEM